MAKIDTKTVGRAYVLGQFDSVQPPPTGERIFNTLDTKGFYSANLVMSYSQLDSVGSAPWVLELEESDDDITYTTVSTENTIGSTELPAAGLLPAGTWALGYIGKKRYVRMKFNNAVGASAINFISAVGFLNDGVDSPSEQVQVGES